MGANCGCQEKSNLLEEINLFLKDLKISKISLDLYQADLLRTIKNRTFSNKREFKLDFLQPLLAVSNINFKDIHLLVEKMYLDSFEKNPTLFLMSLIFLGESGDYENLYRNYDKILYETLPNNLTRVLKTKNELRIFKKIFKFYVKSITQNIINATESYFKRNQIEKNELEDLKVVFSNIYIYEYIKEIFAKERERDFDLKKFMYLNYENMKHWKIAAKIYEIFLRNNNKELKIEKELADLTDEFSEDEDIKGGYLTNGITAPEILGNGNRRLKEQENEERFSIKKEKANLIVYDNPSDNENLEEEILEDSDIVEIEAPKNNLNEENFIEVDSITSNNIGDMINKHVRGYLFRKKFEKIRTQLESHDRKVQEYIITKFTCDKIKKAENQKEIKFDIDGWKNFSDNKEIEKINKSYEFLIETKFTIFDNKEYYSGTLNDKNQKHGFGVSIVRQENKYQGYWLENNYHGWGELIDKKGTIWYGEFKEGRFEGKGEKYNLDGNSYKGDFCNNEKNGIGLEETEFYKYEGQFRNDKKHGKGKILMRLLKDVYEGDFKNDNITGYGKYQWASNHNCYIGEFLNGKMHGKGINKWPDGTIYEGEYVNGIKEGFGKYTKPTGKIYEGGFKEGKPHGHGKITSAKGEVTEVEFKHGECVSNKNQ